MKKPTYTKVKLAADLAELHDLPVAKVRRILDSAATLMSDALAQGYHVKWHNFGIFKAYTRKAWVAGGRAGGTEIPAMRAVTFRPGKGLLAHVREES